MGAVCLFKLRATIARVKPGDSDNYQVRSAPDAGRPLQKSQNGVDADQNHADRQS